MTPEQQQQMETLLDLFEHDGWKLFIEEKEGFLISLKENAHNNCPTNDTWQYNRGMISILEGIISYETAIKYVMEQDQEECQE